MHEVLVNRLGGLSLPRKSVVRLTDRPDMTLDVYRGRKTTMQLQLQAFSSHTYLTFNVYTDIKEKVKNPGETCEKLLLIIIIIIITNSILNIENE